MADIEGGKLPGSRYSATFTGALDIFCHDAASWLTDADAPALTSLYRMAAELDNGNVSPAMLGQFNLAYRALLRRQPADSASDDPLEKLLG